VKIWVCGLYRLKFKAKKDKDNGFIPSKFGDVHPVI
jgi:hypothetical protein